MSMYMNVHRVVQKALDARVSRDPAPSSVY